MAYSDFSKNTLCSVKIYYQQEFFCSCSSLDNRSFPCAGDTSKFFFCILWIHPEFLKFSSCIPCHNPLRHSCHGHFFISSHLFSTYSPNSHLMASLDLKANLCGWCWKSLKQIMNTGNLFYSELLELIHFHVESIRK